MLMKNGYGGIDSNKIDIQKPLKELGGVAIVIEVKESIDDIKSEIIMIIENQKKPWKKIGQLSVPFGTIEDGEDKIETLTRETEEELGLNINGNRFEEKGEFTMYVEYGDINIKVNLYVFYLLLIGTPDIKNENPEEIAKILLQNTNILENSDESKIRPGTKESLDIVRDLNNGEIIYVKDGKYIK